VSAVGLGGQHLTEPGEDDVEPEGEVGLGSTASSGDVSPAVTLSCCMPNP
jgi:hypothetical protein